MVEVHQVLRKPLWVVQVAEVTAHTERMIVDCPVLQILEPVEVVDPLHGIPIPQMRQVVMVVRVSSSFGIKRARCMQQVVQSQQVVIIPSTRSPLRIHSLFLVARRRRLVRRRQFHRRHQ